MQTLEGILAANPFFAGLDAERLERAAGCASNVRFHDGDYLFREGEQADRFFVVRHGAVAVEVHGPGRGPITIETVDAGEVLGWSWLFPPYRWHFDARAVGLVRATAFDGACLRGKCEDDPAFGYDVMNRFAQVLIDRLAATQWRLLDVYGDGARR